MNHVRNMVVLLLCGGLLAACATSQPSSADSGSGSPAAKAGMTESPSPSAHRSAPREVFINPETGEKETRSEFFKRTGVTEDPGMDPDPERIWVRGEKRYRIRKYPKDGAAYDVGKGWVRPVAYINVQQEIYREDSESVWVWSEIFEDQAGGPGFDKNKRMIYRDLVEGEREYLDAVRPEFRVVEIPASGKTIRFEESSHGLPQSGSWRNNVAVADMNGDGHADLITPPQRGPAGVPQIFLGDGTGKWTRWTVSFPHPLNYGGVAVGDVNGDGIPDLVSAVHLKGVEVYLHDGKGYFEESSPEDEVFPTRRVALADFDRDGDLDIVAINEGPMMLREDATERVAGKLRIYLNDGMARQWTTVAPTEDWRQLAGDWLEVADLNGDREPDLITSSIYYQGTDTLYLGKEGPAEFEPVGRGFLPFYSMYFGLTTGKFTSPNRDDAVLSFVRSFPLEIDPNLYPQPDPRQIAGLERVWWDGQKLARSPIVQWASFNSIFAVGSADFDRDGHRDVVYLTVNPRETHLLLGDGKGGFRRARVEGIQLPTNNSYDVTVADINGDGWQDLVMLFEAGPRARDGSVKVWLNRGPK